MGPGFYAATLMFLADVFPILKLCFFWIPLPRFDLYGCRGRDGLKKPPTSGVGVVMFMLGLSGTGLRPRGGRGEGGERVCCVVGMERKKSEYLLAVFERGSGPLRERFGRGVTRRRRLILAGPRALGKGLALRRSDARRRDGA